MVYNIFDLEIKRTTKLTLFLKQDLMSHSSQFFYGVTFEGVGEGRLQEERSFNIYIIFLTMEYFCGFVGWMLKGLTISGELDLKCLV